MIADADSIALAVAFVNATVGKLWLKGATGPDAYCCWGLAQAGQRVVMGRDIPMIAIDEDSNLSIARAMRDHPLFGTWERHCDPRHGDVVKMFSPTNPNHIGVYWNVDRGGIHHSARGDGVRFDPLFVMPANGWSKLEFWRPRAIA